MKKQSLLLIAVLLFFNVVFAQSQYKIDKESKIFIHGTSTLHDWTSETNEISGEAKISTNPDLDISSLEFKVKAESIESGKSKMNSITYDALKTETHPFISFKLNNVKKIDNNRIYATGYVSIAGVKKLIDVTGTYFTEDNNKVIFGTKKIDMTEFNIDPPTAMFGTIVVGKEVEIEFNIKLN